MTKAYYAELRRDPRWQKRRLEVLNKHEFTCLNCQNTNTELHVHHLYYVHGRMPWDYPDLALVCLCKDCHKDLPEWLNIQWLEQLGTMFNGHELQLRGWSEFLNALTKSRYDCMSILRHLTELLDRNEIPFDPRGLKDPTPQEMEAIRALESESNH